MQNKAQSQVSEAQSLNSPGLYLLLKRVVSLCWLVAFYAIIVWFCLAKLLWPRVFTVCVIVFGILVGIFAPAIVNWWMWWVHFWQRDTPLVSFLNWTTFGCCCLYWTTYESGRSIYGPMAIVFLSNAIGVTYAWWWRPRSSAPPLLVRQQAIGRVSETYEAQGRLLEAHLVRDLHERNSDPNGDDDDMEVPWIVDYRGDVEYVAHGLDFDAVVASPSHVRSNLPGLDSLEDALVATAGIRCADVEQLLKLFWRFSKATTLVDYALLLSDVRHFVSPEVSSVSYLAQSFESVRAHIGLFYEPQGDDDTILPLKWLLLRKMAYTVVLTPFVEDASASHFPVLNSYLHRAIPMARDRQGFLQELVSVFMAYMKALGAYLRTGDVKVFHEKPDPVSQFLIDSAELLAEAPGVALADGVATRAPAIYLARLRKAEEQSHRVMALGTDYDRNALRQMQVRIAESISRVQSDAVLNQPRVAPFVVGLSGAPGIGKTGLLGPEIERSLVSAMGEALLPHEIFTVTEGSDYFEGYNAGTRVVRLDDMVITNPAKGVLPPQMAFLHRLEGNAPLHLNMATLESKGKVIALPDIVMVTTNVPHYNAASCVNNPYVIERRVNTWEVEMLSKFMTNEKYSPLKDPRLNGHPEFPRMLMYRFRRYTPSPRGNPIRGEWMYFPTFIAILQKEFLAHRVRSIEVAKSIASGVEMCPKCHIAMTSHFMGQCMTSELVLPKSYEEFFEPDLDRDIPTPFQFEPQGAELLFIGLIAGTFLSRIFNFYRTFSIDWLFMWALPMLSDPMVGRLVRWRMRWLGLQPVNVPIGEMIRWMKVRYAVRRSRVLTALVCGSLLALVSVAAMAWMSRVDASRYAPQGNVPAASPLSREEIPSIIPIPSMLLYPDRVAARVKANMGEFKIHGEVDGSYVSRETRGICLGGTIWMFPLHQFLGFKVRQAEFLSALMPVPGAVGRDYTRVPFNMDKCLIYHERDLIFASLALVPRAGLASVLRNTTLVEGESFAGVFYQTDHAPVQGVYSVIKSVYDGAKGLVYNGRSESIKGQCCSPLIITFGGGAEGDYFLGGVLIAGSACPEGQRSKWGIFAPITKLDWVACVHFFFATPLNAVKPLAESVMKYVSQAEGAFHVSDLPDRSLFRKMTPQCELPGLSMGYVKGVASSSYKPSMFKTPFFDVVIKHHPETPAFLPAIAGLLPGGDYPRSFFNAYVEDVHCMRIIGSHQLVDEVAQVRLELLEALRGVWEAVRPYSRAESMRGVAGGLKAFPRSTSCGLLLTRGDKKKFFKDEPLPHDSGNFVPTQQTLDQLELLESHLRGDDFVPMTVTLAPKMNEVRSATKVLASGARTININSMFFNLMLRQYALPIMEVLVRDWARTGCVIGANPAGPVWGAMHAKMNRWGGEFVSDLDGEKFDKSQSAPHLCGYVFLFVMEIAQEARGYTREDRVVLESLLASLMYPFIVWHGDLFCVNGTNTSGNSLTTYINSLMMIVALRLSFNMLRPSRTMRFEDHVEMLVYGDDLCFAVSPEMKDCMHPSRVAEILRKEGFVMKSGSSKDASLDWRDISEITFLKRRFVPADWKCEVDGVMVAPVLCPLEGKSMLKMLCWRGKSELSLEAHCLEIITNAHAESFMHGRKFFDEWTLMIEECLSVLGASHRLRTYEEFAKAYCDGELIMWSE